MSAKKTHCLWCDGCLEPFQPPELPPPELLGDVRLLAGTVGWEHQVVSVRQVGASPSLDFCPGCVGSDARRATVERVERETREKQHALKRSQRRRMGWAHSRDKMTTEET